jgi:hypothetical protein
MDASKTPCYGKMWDISEPACAGCFVRTKCERLTKMRESGEMPKPTVIEQTEIVEEPISEPDPVSPIEHLLQSLMGKYDRKDRIGDKAVGYFFSENGKDKVLITVSKESGRVRVQAKDYEKITDGIESVEHAEEILAAVSA